MPKTNDRRFKVLGTGWLALGGFALAVVIINLLPLLQGDTPSGLFESGQGWWIVDLVILVVGTIGMVNGYALLSRSPIARSFLAISSIVLLPSAPFLVPLLVVAPSLWLTLSEDGKQSLGSYLVSG